MNKRLNFECWDCKREFTLMVPVDEKPDILSECPYCRVELVIELAPYRSGKIEIFRDGTENESSDYFDIPDKIPTRKPDEQPPDPD